MAIEKDNDIASIRARLEALDAERNALAEQLERLRSRQAPEQPSGVVGASLTAESTAAEKITLFRRLFAGRQDVFPVRWDNRHTGKSGYAPACENEWVRNVCGKPQVKCGECPNQAFIAVSDNLIASHLRGADQSRSGGTEFVAGVYPVLADETCWFLAVDFDGDNWSTDALAYLETCRLMSVPAALERSRSGEGGHVWIFFSQRIPARDARQLGATLLTETLERRPELGFASYDRMFPSQDTLPKGGFGNLIALPLQRRARDYGNSVFVDNNLLPYRDQWTFLASLSRLTPQAIYDLIGEAQARDRVLSVRMPLADDNGDEPWRQSPSRRRPTERVTELLPDRLKIVLSDDIYIDRTALPPPMVARLIRLAAFQNPEYYRAQAMRLPTFGKPRIISCALLHRSHVALPRGCLEEALDDLLTHELGEAPGVPVEDVAEVSRYVEAMNHGLQRLHGDFPLSNRLLREMQASISSSIASSTTPSSTRCARRVTLSAGSNSSPLPFVSALSRPPRPGSESSRCFGKIEVISGNSADRRLPRCSSKRRCSRSR
jgi:hypothetical protein